MLQDTFARVQGLGAGSGSPTGASVTRRSGFWSTGSYARPGADATLVLEPAGRNTAPAVAVAALVAAAGGQRSNVLLLVLPSDHVIHDVAAVSADGAGRNPGGPCGPPRHVRHRSGSPRDGLRVHSRPGRRRVDAPSSSSSRSPICSRLAATSLQAGTTGTAACSCLPRTVTCASSGHRRRTSRQPANRAVAEGRAEGAHLSLGREAFLACRSQSIDYAVMEKTRHCASVVPL